MTLPSDLADDLRRRILQRPASCRSPAGPSRRPATAVVADALGLVEGDLVVHVLRVRFLDGEPAMLERSAFRVAVGLPV